jgi:hypothetical protein
LRLPPVICHIGQLARVVLVFGLLAVVFTTTAPRLFSNEGRAYCCCLYGVYVTAVIYPKAA